MLSPSEKYKLDIAEYKVKDQTDFYKNCMITQVETNKIIAIIDKPSIKFQDFLWFMKNGDEWLQFGQTFVHLDSGLICHKPEDDFNWIKSYISPNADILAVTDLKQFKFFDISDINKGWSELKLNLVDRCEFIDKNECEWTDHNTFVIKDIYISKPYRVRTFRRNDNEMVNIKVYDLKINAFNNF